MSPLTNCSGLAWQINLTFAKHIDAARDPMFEQFINRIRLEYRESMPVKLTCVVKTDVRVSQTCLPLLSIPSFKRQKYPNPMREY